MVSDKDLLRQLDRGVEIDALPDGERYSARQRWLSETVELLLECMLDMGEAARTARSRESRIEDVRRG